MSSFARATAVRFDDDIMFVDLNDGRTLDVPIAGFPRLRHATPKQLNEVQISASGLHWEDLDEDISVEGLIAGRIKAAYPRREVVDKPARAAAAFPFAPLQTATHQRRKA